MSLNQIVKNELVDYLPQIKKVVSSIAKYEDVVDDLSQEVCVCVIEKEKLWSQEKSKLKPWINAITRNLTINYLRRRKKEKRLDDRVQPEEFEECHSFSQEQVEWVSKQFAQLTEKQRKILSMRYYQGMTVIQIGNDFGITHQAVSHHINSALKKLRYRARKQGLLSVLWPWNWLKKIPELIVANIFSEIVSVIVVLVGVGFLSFNLLYHNFSDSQTTMGSSFNSHLSSQPEHQTDSFKGNFKLHNTKASSISISNMVFITERRVVEADFDGDGYLDTAIGNPHATVDDIVNAGSVSVRYHGRRDSDVQIWHQNVDKIKGTCEPEDNFGYCLAAGDFNGDGFADLVIGVPNEDIKSIENAGQINVIYGSSSGLTTYKNREWSQNSTDSRQNKIKGIAEANDRFGMVLAVGDFNNDGSDDLAIGVPFENLGRSRIKNAGQVNVIYGLSNNYGLSFTNNQKWSLDVGNKDGERLIGRERIEGQFGKALAIGDFDGDGVDDLAIKQADDGDLSQINIIFGQPGKKGLSYARNQKWASDRGFIKDTQ